MSFQELAARTGTVVVEGDDRVLIVSGADAARAQCGALSDPRCALVVYKGGRHLPELAAELARVGRLDGAVVGEGFGLPGGRGVAVAAVADRPASYLATVVIPVVIPVVG